MATSPLDIASDVEIAARPSESEIRGQLDTILASEQFCTSRRASEFIRFITDRALRGDLDSLKERLLGIEIFHRRSDYDTSSDAIVRVTANDVRRRLANFDQAHPRESVRVLLPPGSYVPDFIRRPDAPLTKAAFPIDRPDSDTPVLATPPAEAPSISPLHTPSGPGVLSAEERTETGHRLRSVRLPWVAAIACMALIAGVLASRLFTTLHAKALAQEYKFYKDLLGPIGVAGGEQTAIALSNPHLLIYRGSNDQKRQKEDELASFAVPDALAMQLNATANDTQGQFPFHYLQVDDKNYTGLGEAEAAYGLARVFEATGRSARLTQARFLNWDAAREQELVLLGAPHMSAFAQNSLKESNFVMEHDAIRNVHPQAGEQPLYERRINGAELVDYGLIWMGKSPSGSRVFVLAGLTSTGTAGVARFFTDPVRMKPIYDRLRSISHSANCPDSWQVLLRIDAREDVPMRTTAIALRTLGP